MLLHEWRLVRFVAWITNGILNKLQPNQHHLAANKQQFCQQSKRITNLADERSHLETNELKKKLYCETCQKDIKITTESSRIKTASHIANTVFYKYTINLQVQHMDFSTHISIK